MLCEKNELRYNPTTGICDGIDRYYCIDKGVPPIVLNDKRNNTGSTDDCTQDKLWTEDISKTLTREIRKSKLTDQYGKRPPGLKEGDYCTLGKINNRDIDPTQYYKIKSDAPTCLPQRDNKGLLKYEWKDGKETMLETCISEKKVVYNIINK